ncbi:MAG: hypothetical protein H0U10_02360 [Chloroflexia bacterium]|nr:hypothetical protein [Chloroflexia bacterium]
MPASINRRFILAAPLAAAALAFGGNRPATAIQAQTGPVVTPDGRLYDAYLPAATKPGQFYQYSCEFDASWAVLATYGFDVPFEEQLAIVGHDTSIEPYYVDSPEGFLVYGGDITTAYSSDYTSNLLARTTGEAMLPLFEQFGLPTEPVQTQAALQSALDEGALVWMKATVDFLPWEPVTWITPNGEELPGVLGNDHAVVVMGYNAAGVVIRDVLGPTDTNWERPYEYDVPWETFLPVWEAQGFDALAVSPPPAEGATAPAPASDPDPAEEPRQVCC